MSHKNQESLHEFENLIERLSHRDNQPISLQMTPAAKQALRHQLLDQYETATLSRQGARRLWRFAGSVAGIVLLTVAVIGFGLAISQARTIGSPAVNSSASSSEMVTSTSFSAGVPTLTPDNSTLPTPPMPNLPPELPVDLGDNIRLIGFSFSPNSNESDQSLTIALSWETTGQPSANYSAFIHLLDENGRLAAQVDELLGETSAFTDGTKFNAILTLPLSNNLTSGTYTIATGLYDSNTGQQLPQNNNGQGIHLALWEIFAPNLLTQLPAELGDSFRLTDFALSPQPFQPGQPLQVTLDWETTGQPIADYTAFVHLLDQTGNLIAQADQPLGETSTFVNVTRPTTHLTLWLPDNLAPGKFTLTTGLYDSNTGQRLPDNDNGSDLYLTQIEVAMKTAVPHRAVVTGTNNNALTLCDRPEGRPIAVLDEGSIVLLADAPRVEKDGFLWQAIETIDGLSGWVAAEFLTYPDDYQLAEIVPAPFPPLDNVQVISAKQLSRTAKTDPITFEITLKVTLDSADEAILKLFYTNPAWDDGSEIQLPVYMIGGDQTVFANTEVVTVTAVLDPTEMAANVKTNTPTLMTQLGTLDHEKPWLSSFKTSLLSFFDNVQFDLESLDKIEYQFDDQDTFKP